MKRAADDDKPTNTRDGDDVAPDNSGMESPSEKQEEQDPPQTKKARQQSESSSEQTEVAKGSKTASADVAHVHTGRLSQGEAKDEGTDEGKTSASVEGGARLANTEFPVQLMNLLQRNVAPDALWFLEGGEAIGLNRDLIGQKVLNEHFRGMKFNSLVRNLNRWGFRRISHQSLKDKDRGYHHLLFQRDKPDLVHRMRRDSNANEVVRQLEIADGRAEGAPSDESTRQEAKTLHVSERTENGPSSSASQAAAAPPSQIASRGIQAQQSARLNQHGQQHPGAWSDQQQHLLWQGLAAQQQLQWQRQQSTLPFQFGSMHRANWTGLASWNTPSHTLPSASALAAFGLQHQQQMQSHAPQQPSLATSVSLYTANASRDIPAESSQETKDQQDDAQEDSKPSESDNKRGPSH